eukprot:1844297-Rhodomonas_salina.5
MSTLKAMRDMVAEPSNRPAFNLLAKGTLMMVTFPIATYFLCFEYVFAKGGLYDLSEEFNLRINFSGFCALFVVQVRPLHSVPDPQRLNHDVLDRSSYI